MNRRPGAPVRKLKLRKTSLRQLTDVELKNAAGGYLTDPGSGSGPPPSWPVTPTLCWCW